MADNTNDQENINGNKADLDSSNGYKDCTDASHNSPASNSDVQNEASIHVEAAVNIPTLTESEQSTAVHHSTLVNPATSDIGSKLFLTSGLLATSVEGPQVMDTNSSEILTLSSEESTKVENSASVLHSFKNTINQKRSKSETKKHRKRPFSEKGSSPEGDVSSNMLEFFRSTKRQCDSPDFEEPKTPMPTASESFEDIDDDILRDLSCKQSETLKMSNPNIMEKIEKLRNKSGKLTLSIRKVNSLPRLLEGVKLKTSQKQINKLLPIVNCLVKLINPEISLLQENCYITDSKHGVDNIKLYDLKLKYSDTNKVNAANIAKSLTNKIKSIKVSEEVIEFNSSVTAMGTSKKVSSIKEVWQKNVLQQEQSVDMGNDRFEPKSSYSLESVSSENGNANISLNKAMQKSLTSLLDLILSQDIEVPKTRLDTTSNSLYLQIFAGNIDVSLDSNVSQEKISKPQNMNSLYAQKSSKDHEFNIFERTKSEFRRMVSSGKDTDINKILQDIVLQLEQFTNFNYKSIPFHAEDTLVSTESLTADKLRKLLPFIWVDVSKSLYHLTSFAAKILHMFRSSPKVLDQKYLFSLRKQILDFEKQNEIINSKLSNIMVRPGFIDYSDPVYEELHKYSIKVCSLKILYINLLNTLNYIQYVQSICS